jgi:hypothetical protein
MNTPVYHNQIQANTCDWGLGNETLEIQTAPPPEEYVTTSEKKRTATTNGFMFENLGDILHHMSSRKYYHFLKNNLPFTRKFVIRWKCCYPLIWYGLTFPLLRYLEFGVSDIIAAPISALANPCVDITIIANWQIEKAETTQVSPHAIAGFLRNVAHKGPYRLIDGEVFSALKRLRVSTGKSVYYDLIFFQLDLFGERAIALVEKLMEYLAIHGAIVVASTTESIFSSFWEKTKKQNPSYTYLHCFKNEVGIILKTSSRLGAAELGEAEVQHILEKAWRPIKARTSLYYLAKVFELLVEILEKIYYEPLWHWPQKICRLLHAQLQSK